MMNNLLNIVKEKINKRFSNDTQRLASNTFMLYILQISGYIFPLITFPYLTRVLGPSTYGVVIFSTAIMIYFQQLVDFGFLLSATRKCSKYRDDKGKLEQILRNTIFSKLLLSLISVTILILLTTFISQFQEIRLYLLIAIVPIMLSSFNVDYLFRGLEMMKYVTYRIIVVKFVYTVLILVLVRKPEDYIFIPIITSIGESIAIIWVWRFVRKIIKINIFSEFSFEFFSEIKESFPFFVSRFSTTAYSSLNTVILGFNYDKISMGLYGAAYSLSSKTRQLISPFSNSLYPYTVRTKNFKIIKVVLLIFTPVIFIFLLIGYIYSKEIIVFVAGDDYASSYYILRIFLIGLTFALPQYLIAYPVLGAVGMVKQTNYAVFAGAVYHIIGLIIFAILNLITFRNVALLTVSTEFLILLIRCYYIYAYFKLKKYRLENE